MRVLRMNNQYCRKVLLERSRLNDIKDTNRHQEGKKEERSEGQMVLPERSTGAKTMNRVRAWDTLTLGFAEIETVQMSLGNKVAAEMQEPACLTGPHVSQALSSP